MKKKLVIITSAVAAFGLSFNSCDSTPSTQTSLATEIDSVSYSFGASVGESLDGALLQMGILADTNAVAAEYRSKIAAESDEQVKATLEKESRTKIDSITKANQQGLVQFLQGLEKAVQSRPSQESYNFGYAVGTQVVMQSKGLVKQFYGENSDLEVNKQAVTAAIAAGLQKRPLLMPEGSSYLMMKSQELQERGRAEKAKIGEDNDAKGRAFLEENKTKEGVVALESGVQYKILTEGNGEKPTANDMVKCHYHGTLLDGTVFDSSVERGEPATFGVGQVIPGWTEILQLMPVGSKWEVYIPYDKAYGEFGSGDKIGPKETLVFQIELLEVQKAE